MQVFRAGESAFPYAFDHVHGVHVFPSFGWQRISSFLLVEGKGQRQRKEQGQGEGQPDEEIFLEDENA